MFNGIAFAFVLVCVVTLIVRRRFSRNRVDLHTYLHNHGQEVRQQIEAMRLETYRFDAHEALGPVEAGLHELLSLHGNPPHIRTDRENDTLLLLAPGTRIAVIWNFRAASRQAHSNHIYGKGQWEIRRNNEPPEPYTQLNTLMIRLSSLLRELIGEESERRA